MSLRTAPIANDVVHAVHRLPSLSLHCGSIWRWNRPLVGFDANGTPHIRIEHRTPAAGPSVIDMIANAAFYYGLVKNLADERQTGGADLTFAQAKDNFYQAARHGPEAHVVWFDEHKLRLGMLIEQELVPRAVQGLQALGIDAADGKGYLDIIRQRLASQQTGSQWQRRFIAENPGKFVELTRAYLQRQRSGEAVGNWALGGCHQAIRQLAGHDYPAEPISFSALRVRHHDRKSDLEVDMRPDLLNDYPLVEARSRTKRTKPLMSFHQARQLPLAPKKMNLNLRHAARLDVLGEDSLFVLA